MLIQPKDKQYQKMDGVKGLWGFWAIFFKEPKQLKNSNNFNMKGGEKTFKPLNKLFPEY